MEIKINPATGERSIKLTQYERKCMAMAQGVAQAICANLGPNRATSVNVCDQVAGGIELIIDTLVDQKADEAEEEVAEAAPEVSPVPKTNSRQKQVVLDGKPDGAPW